MCYVENYLNYEPDWVVSESSYSHLIDVQRNVVLSLAGSAWFCHGASQIINYIGWGMGGVITDHYFGQYLSSVVFYLICVWSDELQYP